MILSIVVVLVYAFLIYFGIIKNIIVQKTFNIEQNEYRNKQAKMRERYEKRRVVLINNNNTMNDYEDCYMWVDEKNHIWDIDYYNNFILFDKLNKPTKC